MAESHRKALIRADVLIRFVLFILKIVTEPQTTLTKSDNKGMALLGFATTEVATCINLMFQSCISRSMTNIGMVNR